MADQRVVQQIKLERSLRLHTRPILLNDSTVQLTINLEAVC